MDAKTIDCVYVRPFNFLSPFDTNLTEYSREKKHRLLR